MKRLTLTGFVDYMTSEASKQRSILKQYKYPEEDESRAKILYYRDARDRIAAYHRGNENPDWLTQNANQLQLLAKICTGSRKTRLSHNARVLSAYRKYYSKNNYQLLPDIHFALQFEDVLIGVRPDLHVMEGRREKIIKFEFGVKRPSQREINIVSQLLLEAANKFQLRYTGANVLYIDVARGHEHRGARLGSRMSRDIEATCQNISAIWDSI